MSYKWTTYMLAQLETLPTNQRSTRHEQIKEALEEGYLCGVVEMLFDELMEARSVGDDLAVLLEEKNDELAETQKQFTAFQKHQEACTMASLKATAESSALMVAQASQLAAAAATTEALKAQLAKVTEQRDKRAAEAGVAYAQIGQLTVERDSAVADASQARKDLATSARLYEELVKKIAVTPPVPPSPPSRWYRAPEVTNDGDIFHVYTSSSLLQPSLHIRCPSPPPRIQRSCSLACDSPSSLYDE
jgi:hypothetical protein